jgi:MFS family permease
MTAGWALLRRRDFGLLWAGGLVSETGDWFLLVGLPIWVLQLTGSSLVTATVFLVGLLPGLVVGPLAGVLVDRWDRRRTLIAVSLAQATFLLPLFAVDGREDLWILYGVMALEASLAQLNDPARNALVPSLVDEDDLVAANALIGLNSNLARLAGSPLGGILVEVAGLPGLVIGDAASFLLGAALIASVGSRPRSGLHPDPRSVLHLDPPGSGTPAVAGPGARHPNPPGSGALASVGAPLPDPPLPGTLGAAGARHPDPPGGGAPAREGSPTPGSVDPVVHSPAAALRPPPLRPPPLRPPPLRPPPLPPRHLTSSPSPARRSPVGCSGSGWTGCG